MNFTNFVASAKAIASFVGAIVTGLLATQAPGSTLYTVLTILAVIGTAITTYQAPYRPTARRSPRQNLS